MSSKLDEMRNQFRERLNLRPVGETRIHVIKVESNDNNNNYNIYSKLPKSDNNLVKNSITSVRKSVISDDKKCDKPSKSYEKRFGKTNVSSINSKSENSSKTDSILKSRDWDYLPKKDNSGQLSSKKTFEKSNEPKRVLKPKDYFQSKSFKTTTALKRRPSEEEISDGLSCRHCNRRFALSERLQKHESVCISSADKSRQKFDSSVQRFRGQPREYLEMYEKALTSETKEKPKPSNWRQKHQYCIAAIKAAKGVVNSGPTASQIMASIQTQCDYCKRRFNDEAIRRHLPICAKLYHKKLMKY